MKVRKSWLLVNIVALLITAAQVGLSNSPIGQQFEAVYTDQLFRFRGRVPPPKEIVLIVIDRDSYERLEVSHHKFWPRHFHVQLIERLKKWGIKRVVFDLFFQVALDPEGDRQLAEAFKSVPSVFTSSKRGELEFDLEKSRHNVNQYEPLDIFAEAAFGLGDAGFEIEHGAVRRIRPGLHEAFGIATLAEAAVAGLAPLDRVSARDYIRYYGPAGSIPGISYHRALLGDDQELAELFRNKIVFVGYGVASGVVGAGKDEFMTPFGILTYGVEIHATAAANILEGKWLRRIEPIYELLGALVLVFGLALCLLERTPQNGAVILGCAVVAWLVLSYQAFLAGWYIPGVVAMGVVLPLTLVGSSIFYYVISAQAQRHLRRAFSHYLNPEMVEQIVSGQSEVKLGGEEVEAVLLMTDLAGFTSLSQSRAASEVTDLLNNYFTAVGAVVLENRGTLVKFIGDGLFAMWGAPVAVAGGEELAVKSAIGLQEAVAKLSQSGKLPPLRTRVAVHCGVVIAGNLGAKQHFDYTAIGDAVNVTSRLEGLNKVFGSDILVSEVVVKRLSGSYPLFFLGKLKVAGRDEALGVYMVVAPEEIERNQAIWQEALCAFGAQKWSEASKLFEKVALQKGALTKAAKVYQAQIKEYQGGQTPAGWAGELVFLEKPK